MAAKNDSTGAGIGCLFLFLLVVVTIATFVGLGYNWLDGEGLTSHQEESTITAQGNWLVGESKYCSSFPLASPIEGKKTGYALSYLGCDDGPAHRIKIRFWGREEQPEYGSVNWKCTREDAGFVCEELSGVPVLK